MIRGSETVRLAFKLVVRRPGRSVLTLLGLTIGVGAFIAMVSFGEGARRSVLAQFEALGANVIRIQPVDSGADLRARPPAPLTDQDVALLTREATTVARVLPLGQRRASVGHGSRQHATSVTGAMPEYASVHDWGFESGGSFDDVDLAQRAKVCVLGATPVRELFGSSDPLGATVTLANALPCRVIGVLESKGFSTSGNDLDDLVLVPTTTFNLHLSVREGYASIEIEPVAAAPLDVAADEVTQIMMRGHETAPGEPLDFKVSSPLEVVRAVDRTSRILSTLLASIAAVSLLVGGIGIMNIQLVSVAERTHEIGIRGAVGASPRQILVHFLVEALLLTALGTLAGIVLGVTAAALVAWRMGWPRVISPSGVTLSAGFGLVVGVAFGYLPARRAANLDPIHALRHE
jgi:putative ABC transport system permease protein